MNERWTFTIGWLVTERSRRVNVRSTTHVNGRFWLRKRMSVRPDADGCHRPTNVTPCTRKRPSQSEWKSIDLRIRHLNRPFQIWNSLTRNVDTIRLYMAMQQPTPVRHLHGDKLLFVQSLRPERCQGRMD